MLGKDQLLPSSNDYDWLGGGIYFWENNPHRASDWAKTLQRHERPVRRKVSEPFVLGAVIDPGNCLDLLESESIEILETSHEELVQTFDRVGLTLPRNIVVEGELLVRRLDCAVINYVHQRRTDDNKQAFDTVRAAFVEGIPLYPGAGFQRRTHIQICVRNPKQIIGYFRPLI